MRIVVTGGSGFIGSRLTQRLLALGHDVISWDIKPPIIESEECFYTVDVRDYNLVSEHVTGTDVIYHLAGPVLEMSRKNPYESILLQQMGTLAVLEAARTRGVQKVILASSFYVYDGIDDRMVVNEESPLDVVKMELFGALKLSAESLVHAYSTKYGLDYVILRFGSAYGWGDCSNVVKTFLEAAFRGGPIEVWGRGERRNQYTYVDDLADGCVRALHERNEVYNLISPEDTSTRQLAELLREQYGFQSLFNETQKEGASMAYMCSRKAQQRLGWSPIRLCEGIAGMVSETGWSAKERE